MKEVEPTTLTNSSSEWIEIMYNDLVMKGEDDKDLLRAVEKCSYTFEYFMTSPVAIDIEGNAVIAVTRKYFGEEDIETVLDRIEEEIKYIYSVSKIEKDGNIGWMIRGTPR